MSVYFILATNGLMKIGYSENPFSRLRGVGAIVKCDVELKLMVDGDRHTERQFHNRFARLWSHSEWFHYRGALARFVKENEHLSFKSYRRRPRPPKGGFIHVSPEYLRIRAEQVAAGTYRGKWSEQRLKALDLMDGWTKSLAYEVLGTRGVPAGRRRTQATA